MEQAARLEAMAIIGRLTADGETFDRADADRLREILPPSAEARFFSFKSRYSGPGTRLSGHAAGLGDVSMRQDVDWSAGRDNGVRIGSWLVTRHKHAVEIADMWAETNFGKPNQTCRVVYRGGTAVRMDMEQPRTVSVPLPFTKARMHLSIGGFWAPWKTPTG